MTVYEEALRASLDAARRALEDARNRLETAEVLHKCKSVVTFFEELLAEARRSKP